MFGLFLIDLGYTITLEYSVVLSSEIHLDWYRVLFCSWRMWPQVVAILSPAPFVSQDIYSERLITVFLKTSGQPSCLVWSMRREPRQDKTKRHQDKKASPGKRDYFQSATMISQHKIMCPKFYFVPTCPDADCGPNICIFTTGYCSTHGWYSLPTTPLQWRHNGPDGVSTHQPHDCLLNRLFGRRSQKH